MSDETTQAHIEYMIKEMSSPDQDLRLTGLSNLIIDLHNPRSNKHGRKRPHTKKYGGIWTKIRSFTA